MALSASGAHFIAIARDVTAQRELEQQLHQSQKLSGLGRSRALAALTSSRHRGHRASYAR